jgi:hypothetical protein
MTRQEFIYHAQKSGLYRRNIGQGAVATLADLIAQPMSCKPVSYGEMRYKTPSPSQHIGKLIAAGFARLNLDATAYEATIDGVAWLAALKQHNLA